LPYCCVDWVKGDELIVRLEDFVDPEGYKEGFELQRGELVVRLEDVVEDTEFELRIFIFVIGCSIEKLRGKVGV